LDLIVQCFTSPPTQYRLYGRRFLQVHITKYTTERSEKQADLEKTRHLYICKPILLIILNWRCKTFCSGSSQGYIAADLNLDAVVPSLFSCGYADHVGQTDRASHLRSILAYHVEHKLLGLRLVEVVDLLYGITIN